MYSTDKKLKNNKMEADIKKYRIVCEYPADTWIVQERVYGSEWAGGWMEVHRCELKSEKGYYEAKAWIKQQEKGEAK